MLRFPTFTTAIYDQYQSTFNGPAATHAGRRAGRRCAWCLLLAELGLRGRARLRARSAAGAPGRSTRARLGSAVTPVPCSAWPALTVLALGVPLGELVHWLVAGSSTGDRRRHVLLDGHRYVAEPRARSPRS